MDEKKIEAILRHYSAEAQKIKSIEELAELQTEIARDLNHQGDIRSITSELADVYIMIIQLMIIYDIDPEELDSKMAYKLDRQMKRIQEEEKNE